MKSPKRKWAISKQSLIYEADGSSEEMLGVGASGRLPKYPARRNASAATRARGTFRAIVTEKTDAKVGKGASFSRKCLNVSLCTVLLQCGSKLYIYGVLRKSEHACGVLLASALRSGLARLQG